LSGIIKFICTPLETGKKSSAETRFYSFSKACTNKLYIFQQCIILYIKFWEKRRWKAPSL